MEQVAVQVDLHSDRPAKSAADHLLLKRHGLHLSRSLEHPQHCLTVPPILVEAVNLVVSSQVAPSTTAPEAFVLTI